jgi:hypothetical protein
MTWRRRCVKYTGKQSLYLGRKRPLNLYADDDDNDDNDDICAYTFGNFTSTKNGRRKQDIRIGIAIELELRKDVCSIME